MSASRVIRIEVCMVHLRGSALRRSAAERELARLNVRHILPGGKGRTGLFFARKRLRCKDSCQQQSDGVKYSVSFDVLPRAPLGSPVRASYIPRGTNRTTAAPTGDLVSCSPCVARVSPDTPP